MLREVELALVCDVRVAVERDVGDRERVADDPLAPVEVSVQRGERPVPGAPLRLELVRVLLEGPTRYGAIRSAIPGISDHLLSERLKSLEADGLVVRTVLPDTPVRVVYALTDKGADLAAAIEALASWAERWTTATAHA